MKLVHYYTPDRGPQWGLAESDNVYHLTTDDACGGAFLASLLQWPHPLVVLQESYGALAHGEHLSLAALMDAPAARDAAHLLAPIDKQEIWAAGVTYLRSRDARMEESEGAARFYDKVYDAERPELFYKGGASRVSGPNAPIRIRADAEWNVPEPEITLLISPRGEIVGHTLGNDVSSRDIEGENPLYLPQAKVYRQSSALGPVITLGGHEGEPHRNLDLALRIERGGQTIFEGSANTGQMKRQFGELTRWLCRENEYPHGVFLMTGTCLVPEDFTLEPGDVVEISSPEVGMLRNSVVQGE